MERLSCDVVVLGGGTAGCVVAGRLAAESDAEVVVLEAGPDYGPCDSGDWPADLLDGGALVASHSWGYDTRRPASAGASPVELPRARVIGGCSSHNGCIAAVGCVEDYDGWARIAGDERWSADALRPLLARALGRLRVRTYDEDEVGPFHRACLEAAVALGLQRADDLDDLDGGVGFGVEPVNVDGGVRVNTAFAYLDPARGRTNLRIVDRVLCDRIVHGADSVEVVAWRDVDEVRVRAGTAVLAAGSYGSPAILLRSGIGDTVALVPHGIAPVHELPGVGRNLHDHPLVELDFAGSPTLRDALAAAADARFIPEEQTLGKLRSSRATGPYDLHLVPVAAPEHSLLAGRTILSVGAMEPRSRGRLTLASPDPDVAPMIDHGYLTDPHDRAVLLEGVERARKLAATEPLRSLIGAELTPGVDAPLESPIRPVARPLLPPRRDLRDGCRRRTRSPCATARAAPRARSGIVVAD